MQPTFLSSSRALRSSPRRKRIAWALAIAVLLLQTLGAMHRIAHVDAGRMQAADRVATSGGHSMLEVLFGGHTKSKDCDAFDQMSHGNAAVATALEATPAPQTATLIAIHPAWHIAAQARGFLARGPPATA